MDKIRKIIRNSIFQSALFGGFITLIFILIWDSHITKYKVEVDPAYYFSSSPRQTHWLVGDFNGSGNSEMIRFEGADVGMIDIAHYNNLGNLTNQYHIRNAKWEYNLKPAVYDINRDGTSEVVFFSIRNDSVFFNAFNLVRFELVIENLFIEVIQRKRDVYACMSEFSYFGDLNKDGKDELLFSFDAGYGLYPRGIFKIEFPSLKISRSQTEYMPLSVSSVRDFTGDSIPEIFCQCYAPSNVENYSKFTDTISYVTVLDNNLGFLFEPIPYYGQFSTLYTMPSSKTENLFYILFSSRSNSSNIFSLSVLNEKGKINTSKNWEITENKENYSSFLQHHNNEDYVFVRRGSYIKLTPKLLKIDDIDKISLTGKYWVKSTFDFDEDGTNELLSIDGNKNIYIFNAIANEEINFASPINFGADIKIFPYYRNGKTIKFLFDTGAGYFFLNYYKNKHYFLLFVVYGFVFLVSGSIIYLLLYFQLKRFEKKFQTEKQLSELQFNSVKNQLNPHFLFNSLNSVAYMINEGKKEEAYEFLTVNSRLIQRVMDDSKSVKRSLKDEIKFVKDYLKIQQHRFKERFSTAFEINDDVNLKFEVPKMCIHTYVENAIKHAFRNTKEGGLLSVNISNLKHGVKIEITDNGMGRKKAAGLENSSGNGLKIMEEYYQLFEKYYHYSIKCNIIDLKPQGTKVILSIAVI